MNQYSDFAAPLIDATSKIIKALRPRMPQFRNGYYKLPKHCSLMLLFLCLSQPCHSAPLNLYFDGKIEAKVGDTLWPHTISGVTQFMPGINGNALRVGGNYGQIHLQPGPYIEANEGSVLLWVKPVDWNTNDGKFHVFFEAKGDHSERIILYKYFDTGLTLGVVSIPTISQNNITIAQNVDWHPGQWHHLALTWCKDGIFLYVDGKSLFKNPVITHLPTKLIGEITIGDDSWNQPRPSSSLIQDVSIYPLALSKENISNAYHRVPWTPSRTQSVAQSNQSSNEFTAIGSKPYPTATVPINNTRSTPTPRLAKTSVNQFYLSADKKGFVMKTPDDEPLLESAELDLSHKGRIYHLSKSQIQNIDKNGALHQTFSGGDVIASLVYKIAPDGTFTVSALGPITGLQAGDELSLVFNLSRELFKYHYEVNSIGIDEYHLFDNTNSTVSLNLSYKPHLWIGNDNFGLFWFCDSARNWPNSSNDSAIIIKKDNASAQMKITYKGTDQIPTKLTLEMGFYPTGVQTTDYEKVESLRIAPLKRANLAFIWPDAKSHEYSLYGFPLTTQENSLASSVDRIQKRGSLAAPYVTPTFISTDWSEWRSQWSTLWMGNYDATSQDVTSWGAPLAQVLPSDIWANYFAAKTQSFLKETKAKAIYLDNMHIYGSTYTPKGLGYYRENELRNEYPRTQYLKLFSKLTEAAHRSNNAMTIFHTSGQSDPTVLHLADYFVSGEEYNGKIITSYLNTVPLPTWRTEFSTKQWGAKPIIIPAFNPNDSTKAMPTRELMGLVLLHNIAIWPVWCNLGVIEGVYGSFDTHVPVNSSFVRYDSQKMLYSEDKMILISIYRVSANKNVAIIFNSNNNASISTYQSEKAFSMISNIENDLPVSKYGNAFSLNVKPHDFVMLELTN